MGEHGEIVFSDVQKEKIIELISILSSNGEASVVAGNLHKATLIANQIKQEWGGIPLPQSEYEFSSMDEMMLSFSRSPLSKISSSFDKLSIYVGFYRKNNTSQIGCSAFLVDQTALGEDHNHIGCFYGYKEVGSFGEVEISSLDYALHIASHYMQQCKNITIYCASEYAVKAVTLWSYTWSKNGWRKKGGAIKHLKKIQDAHSLYDKIKNKVTVVSTENGELYSSKGETRASKELDAFDKSIGLLALGFAKKSVSHKAFNFYATVGALDFATKTEKKL